MSMILTGIVVSALVAFVIYGCTEYIANLGKPPKTNLESIQGDKPESRIETVDTQP